MKVNDDVTENIRINHEFEMVEEDLWKIEELLKQRMRAVSRFVEKESVALVGHYKEGLTQRETRVLEALNAVLKAAETAHTKL